MGKQFFNKEGGERGGFKAKQHVAFKHNDQSPGGGRGNFQSPEGGGGRGGFQRGGRGGGGFQRGGRGGGGFQRGGRGGGGFQRGGRGGGGFQRGGRGGGGFQRGGRGGGGFRGGFQDRNRNSNERPPFKQSRDMDDESPEQSNDDSFQTCQSEPTPKRGAFKGKQSLNSMQMGQPKGMKSGKQQKGGNASEDKLKFGDSSDDEDEEALSDEEMDDEMDSLDEDDMESEEEEEAVEDLKLKPQKNAQLAQKKAHLEEKVQKQPVTGKQVQAKKIEVPKLAAGKKAPKEKLNFDESSDDDDLNDEEMDDEMGSSDEDEMESEEEEEDVDVMNKNKQPVLVKQKQTMIRESDTKLKAIQPSQKKAVQEKSPVVSAKKQQVAPKKEEPKVQPKKDAKEKLNFDESSDDEDLSDEEMDDEMGSSDEDEMESEEEEEADEQDSKLMAKGKQNESQKRKFGETNAESTTEQGTKKARLEEGAVQKLVKGKEVKQEMKKEKEDKAKKNEPEQKVDIPKVPAERQKAILAEEERRRDERNKRSLFLSSQTFLQMKRGEIKALHPDVISVRQQKKVCWLLFPSEAATNKAYTVLSNKKDLGGKELVVDYCDPQKRKAKNEQQKQGKETEKKQGSARPINPLELVLSHVPTTTTENQLKVLFPTANRVKVINTTPNVNPKSSYVKSAMAFVTFPNEMEAKKAFEKSGNPTLKIAGEPVDVFYARIK